MLPSHLEVAVRYCGLATHHEPGSAAAALEVAVGYGLSASFALDSAVAALLVFLMLLSVNGSLMHEYYVRRSIWRASTGFYFQLPYALSRKIQRD